MKRLLFAGAAAVVGSSLFPAAALADPPYVFTQCDASTCYVISCTTIPNINGTGWEGSGCFVIDSYPRPREMSGD